METSTETTKSETKTNTAAKPAAKKASAKASPLAKRQRALAAKKAPKRAAAAKPARKPRAAKWEGTTTSFVLQPEMAELSGPEIVALGKKVGLDFSAKYVYTLRFNAKKGGRSRTAKASKTNGATTNGRVRAQASSKLATNGDASKQLLRAAGELGWSTAIGLIEEHRAAMQA